MQDENSRAPDGLYLCNPEKGDVKIENPSEFLSVRMCVYDEEEIHRNCTVQIWKNTVTGECSIGWWENE